MQVAGTYQALDSGPPSVWTFPCHLLQQSYHLGRQYDWQGDNPPQMLMQSRSSPHRSDVGMLDLFYIYDQGDAPHHHR